MRIGMSIAALTVSLLVASPSAANANGYTGFFHVKVTGGKGCQPAANDPYGPPTIFDLTGNIFKLSWSTVTSFDVPSPYAPSQTVSKLVTQTAYLNGPSLQQDFLFTNDPYQDTGVAYVGANHSGNQDIGSFLGYRNENDGLDTMLTFAFTNGAKDVQGDGEFTVFNDGTDNYLANFKFSIIDGRAFAAVPEPTTWAVMVIGFGLVGASMRRRLHTTVTYT